MCGNCFRICFSDESYGDMTTENEKRICSGIFKDSILLTSMKNVKVPTNGRLILFAFIILGGSDQLSGSLVIKALHHLLQAPIPGHSNCL